MISQPDSMVDYFLSGFKNRKAVYLFCKSLVAYVLLKMILLWSVSRLIADVEIIPPPENLLPYLLFWPSTWAAAHHTIFYSGSLLILMVSLLVPWNYITSTLFFFVCLNLARFHSSIINGSDIVVTMLAFWAVGMSVYPQFRSPKLQVLQVALFTFSVLFCQLQVAAIYLVSGWDKVWSETWQSGDAFAYISHFDALINPYFATLLEGKEIQIFLSWLTILFELSFVVLVWFRRTRIPILLIGVCFHLVIAIMLTLPDFGILMILSYLVFLKDSDYDRIKVFFKRLLQ